MSKLTEVTETGAARFFDEDLGVVASSVGILLELMGAVIFEVAVKFQKRYGVVVEWWG